MPALPLHKRFTLLIFDSSEIFQAGLAKTIHGVSESYAIVCARNRAEVKALLTHSRVDLILSEVNLGSAPFIRKLRMKYPQLKMIGYGNIRNYKIIKKLVTLGLNGYLFKNDPRNEFTNAIKTVIKNELFYGESVRLIIQNKLISENELSDEDILGVMMKGRFREILYLIYHQKTPKEISSELKLPLKTVDSYLNRLQRLIGANNIVGLALFAERHQIHLENDLQNKFNIKEKIYSDY